MLEPSMLFRVASVFLSKIPEYVNSCTVYDPYFIASKVIDHDPYLLIDYVRTVVEY